MSGSSVLCIGGGGFLGSHIARLLHESKDFTPTVIDLTEAKLRLSFANQPYNFERMDITEDGDDLDALIASHDIVLNMASVAHPKHYVDHPLDVIDLNLKQGLRIIEACSRTSRRLIHFSTSEVYGKSEESDGPFREEETDCRLGPISRHRWIYSCTKQMLDRIIHAHGLERGLDYTILRPFNVIGPLQDHLMADEADGCPRVLAQFMSALIGGRDMVLVDGGEQRRCFTDVRDLASAILTILRKPEMASRRIFNIGNPVNDVTIRELAEKMRALYEELSGDAAHSLLVERPASEFYGEGYEDTPRRVPDIAAISGLDWQPQHDLDAALRHAMTDFLKNREAMMLARLEELA